MTTNGRVLTLFDRKELDVTGVKEVVSFDESGALLITEIGELEICGTQIHISNLDTSEGCVHITGKIDSMVYADDVSSKRKGFFGKLFG